jgi:hypothetical protein
VTHEQEPTRSDKDAIVELDGAMLRLIADAATSTQLMQVALMAFAAGRQVAGDYHLEVTGARLIRVTTDEPHIPSS